MLKAKYAQGLEVKTSVNIVNIKPLTCLLLNPNDGVVLSLLHFLFFLMDTGSCCIRPGWC
jgi:hypothetical protein